MAWNDCLRGTCLVPRAVSLPPQLLLGRGVHTAVRVKGVMGFPDMLKPEEVGEGVKQCPLDRPTVQGHCSGDGGGVAG